MKTNIPGQTQIPRLNILLNLALRQSILRRQKCNHDKVQNHLYNLQNRICILMVEHARNASSLPQRSSQMALNFSQIMCFE